MSDIPRQLPNELDGDYINRLADHFGIPRYMTKQIRLPEKQSSGWQPIETAPKDGTVVLCWDEFKECDLMWYGIIQQWNEPKDILGWMYVATNTECYPTHWMPLPKPPTE